jgi:o-succinylbenzoate synthase
MIVTELNYSPHQLKLKKHFESNSINIFERNILLVQLKTNTNIVSIGEIAPLPGLSIESIDECIQALNSLSGFINDSFGKCTTTDLFAMLNLSNMPCAVIFGMEQALFSILFQENNYSLFDDYNIQKEINVNAVLPFGATDEIIATIESKINLGYHTFKIKVGRKNFADDLYVLKSIREKFQNKIKIRIDANCAWTFNQAVDYLNPLTEFNIEYIEQPVRDIDELIRLSKLSSIPIAVDESINSFQDAESILNNSPIDFLVIKPSIIGGIRETARIIKLANAVNKKIIISSAFESAIGKRMLVMLASVTNHNYAHGLDTMEYFSNQIIDDSFSVANGKINFSINMLS